MPFKFKLQGILRLREIEEKEAQIELGRLRQEEYRLKRLVDEIIENRKDWSRKYNQRAKTDSPEQDMMMIGQYLVGLEATQRYQEGEIRKMQVRIEAQLEVVERTYRARKQMEILKDKQKEVYEAEVRAQEAREVSELNMLRYLFNARSEQESNPLEGGVPDE